MPTFVARAGGRVQGVGFRPFVYRLAQTLRVCGIVANTPTGVVIKAQGRAAKSFLQQLRSNPPRLARITEWTVRTIKAAPMPGFRIMPSNRTGLGQLDPTPDLALCADCAKEIAKPGDRRFGYPFTNCIHCGPRYSIITALPYDRPRTTMAGFALCPDCRREYSTPANRRFHAQPVCCPVCGPHLDDGSASTDRTALDRAARALRAGRIVALKSIGGFQLACRADRDPVVARLRRLKHRPTKPLALMCASPAAASRLVRLSAAGKVLLSSGRAPVVLLPRLQHAPVSELVAPSTDRLGVMLPYTPLHRLLFDRLTDIPALVMTSGNRRGEPIALDSAELATKPRLADLVLDHNRPIANRCDDSVVLADSPPVVLRRSRGYVPEPVPLAPMFHVKQPVLGVGADARNAFALAKDDRAIPGPYLGDMDSLAVERFFEETLDRFLRWYRTRPRLVACDLHPDYHSARLAERVANRFGARLVRVQHHLAHMLGAMAENGITGTAIGLAADGTGLGSDYQIWGCEVLLVRPGRDWARVGHLDYLESADSGAELADPVRVAVSYLAQAGERQLARRLFGRGTRPVQAHRTLKTSSLGRLFDSAAAILGVCRKATFEGEAAVALEATAGGRLLRGWFREADLSGGADQVMTWDPRGMLSRLARAAARGASPGETAARFHETVVSALAAMLIRLARYHSTSSVVLTGGAMVNSLLRNGLTRRIEQAGMVVYRNRLVPPNDGGIALGQAVFPAVLPDQVSDQRGE